MRNLALLGVALVMIVLWQRRQFTRRRALQSLTIFICLGAPASAHARFFRVGQIPNGEIKSCDNCHVNPGGPRNAFGQQIDDGFLDGPGGNVVWNATLAALDSDQDGRTNGAELQDPSGAWRPGLPNPGSAASVTLPGTADQPPKSVPALSHAATLLFAGLLCWVSRRSPKT